MKILVTGATGFLGKYVIEELLDHEYSIVAFGRNEKVGKALESECVQFVKGDLSSIEELRQAFQSVDAVVHAGALSTAWGPWKAFYQANVIGTQNVLDLCREYAIKHLSSPSIYAAGKDQFDIKESDAPTENHLNNYIRSKLASEKLFPNYPDVPSIILRPRGLFGVGDTSILPRVLRLSRKIGIPLIRGGEQLMDMTCVENVALAIRLALEAKEAYGQVYNITNGEPKTFKYLIETTLKGLGEPIHYRKIPAGLVAGVAYSLEGVYRFFHMKAEPPLTRYTYYLLRFSQTLNIQKAQTELGYYPKMTIEEGIDKYVQHDQAH